MEHPSRKILKILLILITFRRRLPCQRPQQTLMVLSSGLRLFLLFHSKTAPLNKYFTLTACLKNSPKFVCTSYPVKMSKRYIKQWPPPPCMASQRGEQPKKWMRSRSAIYKNICFWKIPSTIHPWIYFPFSHPSYIHFSSVYSFIHPSLIHPSSKFCLFIHPSFIHSSSIFYIFIHPSTFYLLPIYLSIHPPFIHQSSSHSPSSHHPSIIQPQIHPFFL